MFSRLRIRGPLTDRTLSMGASGRHPRRALFGSLIALTLASPLVWTAPASATDIAVDEICTQVISGGPYWNLSGFAAGPDNGDDGEPGTDDDFLGFTSEYEVVDGSVTFTTTTNHIGLGWIGFEIEFYSEDNCTSDSRNPSSTPPTGFKMCVGATEGSVNSFGLTVWSYEGGGSGVYVYPPSELNTTYDLDSISGDTWRPGRIDIEDFTLVDGFEGEITIEIKFGTNPVCGAESGGGSENGPTFDLDLDIDPETFLNRVSAESGALPDTL